MKYGSLTILEVDMIKIISKHFPYSEDEVKAIYRKYESYDKVIFILTFSMKMNRSPKDINF